MTSQLTLGIKKITPPKQATALRVALLFLFSAFVLSWLSPDSFLMHEWGSRGDCSWFFTCGKAWMEGLTPYVDFTDSKGPVLWLVYGLAYLLTLTSYSGVLWMSVVALTVTLEFVWRTSRLFAGRRTSLVAVVMMSVIVLLRPIHSETKAEDFCLPWITIGLYYTCLVLKAAPSVPLRRAAFWTGVGMAWCLLVKWNVFFMMGGMALVIAGTALARKRADAVGMGLLGMAVVCVPMAVWFAVAGDFSAFVQEYFVNTFVITDNGNDMGTWRSALAMQFADVHMAFRTLLLYAALVGACLFCRRFRFSWWLVFACLPFFLFLLLKSNALHYCLTIMPFFTFGILYAARLCPHSLRRMSAGATVVVLTVVVIANIAVSVHRENLRFTYNPYSVQWDAIQRVLTTKRYPKIMFNVADNGVGLKSRALPACKYYAKQRAATADMTALRIEALRQRKPDFFAFIMDPDASTRRLLHACGYRQCFATVTTDGHKERIALPIFAKE